VIRRISIAFLATIYLVVAVGVTISGHFCGGYLESYSFSITSDQHDCCGGMPMDNNCCENVQVTIKSSEDHFASDVLKIEQPLVLFVVPVYAPELFSLQVDDIYVVPVQHPPPLLSKCPVHIQNRVLII
jgi:hypothetical protein